MSKKYKISQLIMNDETPEFCDDIVPKEYPPVCHRDFRLVSAGNKARVLSWINDSKIESIKTPEGKELTYEELFDFVIGNNITDFARTKNKKEFSADIAIVLGSAIMKETFVRAAKVFELYKQGIVKKIIFSGGIQMPRDVKDYMHPASLKEFMDNRQIIQEWSDLTESDWAAQTFVPNVFDEDYQKYSQKLTDEFLEKAGINLEDVLAESVSKSTYENALFCKNAFDVEEIETGLNVRTALLVTSCIHGDRALRQFQKVFGDNIKLTWCPSTLDLEKYESLKVILYAKTFDEEAFRKELKRIYCTTPQLMQTLKNATGTNRNMFIYGYFDDPEIIVN